MTNVNTNLKITAMSSNFETGHAKNVANFGKLYSICSGYGTAYNPSKSALSLRALSTMQSESQNCLTVVHSAFSVYKNAIAEREVAFKPFSKFITRVMNALKASESTEEIDEKASSLVLKLQGRRASAKLTEEEKQTLAEEGKEQKEISSSQLSFDSRIDNFDKLIALLSSIPAYNPNEEDLKLDALKAYLEDLKSKNAAVVETSTALSNARISRNSVLYKENSGLVDTAQDVKSYVKSVFGAGAPQFKQVSGLEFRKINE
jgi:hypothetical protein